MPALEFELNDNRKWDIAYLHGNIVEIMRVWN